MTIMLMIPNHPLTAGAFGSSMQPGAVPLSEQDNVNPGGQLQCCKERPKSFFHACTHDSDTMLVTSFIAAGTRHMRATKAATTAKYPVAPGG